MATVSCVPGHFRHCDEERTNKQTNDQLGDPRASLLLTRWKGSLLQYLFIYKYIRCLIKIHDWWSAFWLQFLWLRLFFWWITTADLDTTNSIREMISLSEICRFSIKLFKNCLPVKWGASHFRHFILRFCIETRESKIYVLFIKQRGLSYLIFVNFGTSLHYLGLLNY